MHPISVNCFCCVDEVFWSSWYSYHPTIRVIRAMIIIPIRAAERIVICYYCDSACYIFSSISEWMLNSNHGIWLCSLVSRLQYVIGHYGRNHTKIIQHRLKSFEATTWWFIYLMNGMNPHLTNKGSSLSPGAYFKTGIHNISLKHSCPPSRAPRLLVAEWYQSLMALSSSLPFNRYRK